MKIHNIINESQIASEHVKGGLDSYYQLTKAKRLAKADGHDYDKLPEYDRGADQPHKEKYMALAKEVKEVTEGEERSIIADACIEKLVDTFGESPGLFADNQEELIQKMYSDLEAMDVEDVVDPTTEVGGQPIGNFASGRVVDVIDPSDVIDNALQHVNLADLEEQVSETDDEVDTGPTWKDDLEDALDRYPADQHDTIKDGTCPECGGNGYSDGDEYDDDGEENSECNGMYDYDCDEGEIRDNTWADEIKLNKELDEPQAPKQPAPSKEQIMKILPRLHDDYVKTGRYNAFALTDILKQMYPELNKREASGYVADFLSNFKESEELNDLRRRAGLEVKEAPDYDASDIHRGDAVTCKQCKGKGCEHCDYKGVHPKERAKESKRLGEEKGRGPTGIAYTVSQGHPDAEDPKTRKKYPERQSAEYKAKFNKAKPGLKQYTEGLYDEGEKVKTAKGNIYTWAEADRDYSMYSKFTYEGGEFAMYYDPQMGQFDNREPIQGDPRAQQVIDSLPDEYFANDEKETVISGIIDMILEYADPQTEELNDLRKRAGLEVRAVSEESLHEESFDCDDKFFETYGWLDADTLEEAEYQGRKVKLNKPMQGDVKKFKVYVKDPKTGNTKKVNFGHGGSSVKGKAMKIRKNNPKARKSFRARHNCDSPGPKTKARYWSCRKW